MTRRRRWPPDRIRAFQEARLRSLVERSFAHVPYYRRLFEQAGLDPADIRTIEDLPRIPISRKSDYCAAPLEDLVDQRKNQNTYRLERTSGSTGIPMAIPVSRRQHVLRGAVLYRGRRDAGARLLDRSLTVGSLHTATPSLLRRTFSTTVRLNRSCPLDQGIEMFRRYRPHNLAGLPTQIEIFAEQVRKAGLTDFRPRRVLLGGETLSPQARARIQDTFRAPVRMFYGSWEFGFIACECREGRGYHLISDHVLVECLRDGRPAEPGEEGELVLTALSQNVMPLVRYGIGDLAVPAPRPDCACSLPGPTLHAITGRQDDILTLADGRRVTPFLPTEPLFRIDQLRQYRVTQEAPARFRVDYVSDSDLPEHCLQEIRAFFSENLQAEHTEIVRVDHIPPDPSGKIRRVISLNKR